jgi:mRNA interferase RelE/StbE
VGRSFLILSLWPLLVFIEPEFITGGRDAEAHTPDDTLDPVFRELRELSLKEIAALSKDEQRRLDRVIKAEEEGTTFFADSTDFEDVLVRFWDEAIPPEVYCPLNAARWRLSDNYDVGSGILFSRREPDWYVGFSTEFIKSIASIDKNKRARVLEAIGKLADAPTTPHGDTIKPLTGDLAGLWRYRIGDDRLVYKPNDQSKKVVLVSFGARSGIYG